MPRYYIVKLTQVELDALFYAAGNFTMEPASCIDHHQHMAMCRAEQQLLLAREERTRRVLFTREQIRSQVA